MWLIKRLDRLFTVRISNTTFLFLKVVIPLLSLFYWNILSYNAMAIDSEKRTLLATLNIAVGVSIFFIRLSRKYKILFTILVAYDFYVYSLPIIPVIINFLKSNYDSPKEASFLVFFGPWSIINTFMLYLLISEVKIKGKETTLEKDLVSNAAYIFNQLKNGASLKVPTTLLVISLAQILSLFALIIMKNSLVMNYTYDKWLVLSTLFNIAILIVYIMIALNSELYIQKLASVCVVITISLIVFIKLF